MGVSNEAMSGDAAAGCRAGEDGQELPRGFKLTDVGVIPDDWQVKRLGELGRVVRGGSPRPAGDPRFFNGSFIPWLTVAALTSLPGHELRVSETASGLTEEGAQRSRTLGPGTLIIANSGATLGVAKILALKCCANDGIAAIINQRSGDKPFLCYYVNTQTERLRDIVATGNGQPNLNTTLIAQIRVPFPTTTEQRAIAEALSDVDGLLGALAAVIAKKRAIKLAAMQRLLTGKARLPGFSGVWETQRLGRHVTFLRHGTHARANLTVDAPVRYLHYGDIHACKEAVLNPRETSMPRLPVDRAAGLDRLEDGDLVLVDASEDMKGVGKSVELTGTAGIEVVSGLHTIAARFDKSVLADGFKAYLQFCPAFREGLARLAAGTKVYATNRTHIASVEMSLPRIDEQAAIAAVLSEMDTEIAALEARRDKTRAIKQGMMQQLLTGRVRLVRPKIEDKVVGAESKEARPHSKAFNEAVVISSLAERFGSEQFPLGRKRYTKLSYLLHRHTDGAVEDYLKKAAGPYNPKTKYGGPERIALESGYVREQERGKYRGFIRGENARIAEAYFEKWYGPDALPWLDQFRYTKNDDLELLATVDMAAEDLRRAGEQVNAGAVAEAIRSQAEWKAKLDRPVFSDSRIASALEQCQSLFRRGSP